MKKPNDSSKGQLGVSNRDGRNRARFEIFGEQHAGRTGVHDPRELTLAEYEGDLAGFGVLV